MKINYIVEEAKKIADRVGEEHMGWFFGIRYEDKNREEGEKVTDSSRHNEDREDERDFPEYGTPEYEEMEELDGVSTWNVYNYPKTDLEQDSESTFTDHCYLIGGYPGRRNETGDNGEIVIKNGIVIKKFY